VPRLIDALIYPYVTSMVLNPQGKHYEALKEQLRVQYQDTYWGEDSVFMERNSRDFIPRVYTINSNTEALCDFLRSRSLASPSSLPSPNTVLKEVYYPKWQSRENYDACRRLSKDNPYPSGFSGLFSVTFTTIAASRAFFDNLDCAKGPSLGTNFTLACPYTILAHYAELDWAESCGVETGLVRVSVGLEEREELLAKFAVALEKAEQTAVVS
jgi:cystathionine gamma-synthase